MKSFDITNDEENKTLKNILFKSFQSCNINFGNYIQCYSKNF